MLSSLRPALFGLAAAGLLASPLAASAVTLDFEALANGEFGAPTLVFVTPDATVTIDGSGSNLGEAAFDTDPGGPNAGGEDTDLLVDTGIALILQDQNEPGTSGCCFTTPDDDADGGTLSFVFSSAVTMLSLDLIDINGNGPATVTLIDGEGDERVYDVPLDWTGDIAAGDVGIDTLDLTTLLPQVGVGPGNPSATASEDVGFDADGVVAMDVFFFGSAALDNVVFVPEPGLIGMFAVVGAGALLMGRRRR